MLRPLSPLPLPRNAQTKTFKPNIGSRFNSWLQMAFGIALLAMLLTGCGGGGGSSSSAPDGSGSAPPPEVGELIVGLTDAEGDFITYEVDVTALELIRANGDVVQTLPLTTRVDFAELTEVTEFLTIATVPAGNYDSVVVRMDYANQNILVEGAAGDAIAVQAVDTDGAPIEQIDMRLSLTTSDMIRIAPGRPAAFSLDFDLQASNEVDLANAEVVVDAFLLATPELETDREHRVRGVLASVAEDDSSFLLKVRPFRHRQGEFGELAVTTDDTTQYEIDGQGFTGAEGLGAMALLAENTPVITHGQITDAGLVADTVIAGSSVPWADADALVGVVAARSGDVLTLRGAHIEFGDGRKAYRGTFEVVLSDETSISAVGLDNAMLSKLSVSVGQRIVAWGEFSDDESLVANRVRMQMNQLSGAVVQASPLAVDLFALNGRNPEVFDFSGTGVTPDTDADPDFYEIDLNVLAVPQEGDLVRVRGIVNEFAAAPADYLARTLIDINTDRRAGQLLVAWQDGTTMPFTSLSAESIEVDLTAARHALKVRGVPAAFIGELTSVVLGAPAEGQGVYAVKVRGAGEVHMYRHFNDLVDELLAQMDAGRSLHRISGVGAYNVGGNVLTTGRAGFVFSAPDVQ